MADNIAIEELLDSAVVVEERKFETLRWFDNQGEVQRDAFRGVGLDELTEDRIEDLTEAINARVAQVVDDDGNLVDAPWRRIVSSSDLDVYREEEIAINYLVNELASEIKVNGADQILVTVVSRTWEFENNNWQRSDSIQAVGRRSYPINQMPEMGFVDDDTGMTVGSDWEDTNNIRRVVETVIIDNISEEDRRIRANAYNARRRGAFFPYVNKSPLDLTKYQIFDRDEDGAFLELASKQCLVYAFEQCPNLDKKTKTLLADMIQSREVSRGELKTIAKKAGIKIVLRDYCAARLNADGTKKAGVPKARTTRWGSGPEVHLGLIEKHYFLNDEVNVSRFAIKNIEDCLKAQSDDRPWYTFTKRSGTRLIAQTNFKSIDALTAIRYLLDEGYFEKMTGDELMKVARGDEAVPEVVDDSAILSREVEYHERKDPEYAGTVYFDYETDTSNRDKEGPGHVPYCVSASKGQGNMETFYGGDCTERFLEWVYLAHSGADKKRNVLLYAHNLGYDLTFILNSPAVVRVTGVISRGQKVYGANILYKNRWMSFRDSYALISSPLRSFPKMFGLTSQKEAYPYDLYQLATIEDDVVSVESAMEYLSDADRIEFATAVEVSGASRDGGRCFSKEQYCKFYCEQDVRLLRDGVETFREQVLEALDLDIQRYMSIASIAHSYMKKEGAFEGVHELAGAARLFIEQCVHGGRVMCSENKMWHVQKRLADYDAVSLYPSAMAELEGYVTGPPESIKEIEGRMPTFEELQDQYNAWYAKVVVKSITTPLDFPLIIRTGENGSIDYTNECPTTMYVDNKYAEDLIEYQGAELEIIEGYGFEGDYNTKIGEVIRHCFEERLRLKKVKNPLQLVWKLVMNSSYGKTVEKAHDCNVQVKRQDELRRYIRRNYENIKEIEQISEKFHCVKVASEVISHYNQCHIGATILSQSKRIMSRVMTLAQAHGIKIYYQDTDSMHVEMDRLADLIDLYQEAYGRVLDGNNMGQFNSDFEIKGCAEETVASVESYFLGKKVYIDQIEGVDAEDGHIHHDNHIRMKGVSTKSVLAKAEELGVTPLELYGMMYNGEVIEFDLCKAPQGEAAPVRFKKDNLASIRSIPSFTRRVGFTGEKVEVTAD